MSRSRSRSRGRYGRSRSPRRRPRSRSRDRREPKSYSDHLYSVKITDLSRDTRNDDIKAKFERFGRIGDVFMPRDRETKENRGFGFVRFYDKRDMEDCLDEYERRGPRILGREIRVMPAPPRPLAPGRSGEQEVRHHRRSRSRSRSRSRRRSRSRSDSRSRSRSR